MAQNQANQIDFQKHLVNALIQAVNDGFYLGNKNGLENSTTISEAVKCIYEDLAFFPDELYYMIDRCEDAVNKWNAGNVDKAWALYDEIIEDFADYEEGLLLVSGDMERQTTIEEHTGIKRALWRHAVQMYYKDSPAHGSAAWALQDWCGKRYLEAGGEEGTLFDTLVDFFGRESPVGMTTYDEDWYPRDGWGDYNTGESTWVDGETLIEADLKGLTGDDIFGVGQLEEWERESRVMSL